MVILKWKMELRGPLFDKRAMDAALTKAWQKVGEFWHNELLPKHFTNAGATEYGYAPRTQKYLDLKKQGYKFRRDRLNRKTGELEIHSGRRSGVDAPLVWTGDSRHAAKQTRDVKATPHGCTITLRGLPRYIWMSQYGERLVEAASIVRARKGTYVFTKAQNRQLRMHNMVRELTTISEQEQALLADMFQRAITDALNTESANVQAQWTEIQEMGSAFAT